MNMPNFFIRCVGQVVAVKCAMKFVCTKFEMMDEVPWCLVPYPYIWSCDNLVFMMIVPNIECLHQVQGSFFPRDRWS
jgi:hypothetical protein